MQAEGRSAFLTAPSAGKIMALRATPATLRVGVAALGSFANTSRAWGRRVRRSARRERDAAFGVERRARLPHASGRRRVSSKPPRN